MFSWLQKINSKILSKITLLVLIEVILIVGSFGALAYFQSEQSSLGNSINIAGKNRYLTANLLLQTEKYLFGSSSSTTPATTFSSSNALQLKDSMSSLESNILTLKQGGKISDIDLKPLPPNLLGLWNSVENNWNTYKDYLTNKVLALPSSGTRIINSTTRATTDQSLERKEVESMASKLIESSDNLVTSLGQQTDKNTENLMVLQILFAILIISILALILYLVRRILRPIFALTQALSKVKRGNLDASVKHKGCDELSILSQSFNSMVDAIREYSKKQNELTKDLQVANEELKYKHQLKDEFINIAAHELRTPIQPIIGLSEIIRSRRFRSSSQDIMVKGEGHNYDDEQYLDVIVRNAKRLQALSENILDVTRIESRTLKLNKEEFNINEKIRNVIEDIKSKTKGGGEEEKIEIVFDKQEVDPIVVEADSLRIYQVISNLLINALKSSKKRIDSGDNNHSSIDYETNSTITVLTAIKKFDNIEEKNSLGAGSNSNSSSSSSSILSNNHHIDEVVIISIKDRGTGIDPDIKDKLFSKFVTKSDVGGSGLGLYISRGIVEAHGGKIWAENNIDGKGGATFSFSLPIL
ncbi:MAG TPA: HAMP domain-containing sensor histidine kinase [Nitrososphaeraceae archaeon]|nr:HAMP domain-containing sensor histidine kinase [Nitrososphaeraceae archaeon]